MCYKAYANFEFDTTRRKHSQKLYWMIVRLDHSARNNFEFEIANTKELVKRKRRSNYMQQFL